MPVNYELHQNIAVITLNDGKANAVSTTLLENLNQALDQAEKNAQAVVLSGRPGRFSAGFDLSIMGQGGTAMAGLVAGGAKLAHRMLQFPLPIVIACTGHALAMGGLMLLSADYRIGVDGAFKIGLNEVAIGLTMPLFGVELARGRLNTPHFHRAVINAEIYSPRGALEAGFLDQVVTEAELANAAMAAAVELTKLNQSAHHQTKLRVRNEVLAGVAQGVEKEFGIQLSAI
ncbi:MAG: crotonase/enoyl-CoA hydratase family protein [Gammaproteobacteria bacterium]|nr:crotonase/enoyl-CoA hydratase family protein [Gammaproteobacteria bacterium]